MRLQFDLWLHLARTDKIVLGKLLLISGLSRDFLSAFDEGTIDEIIQSFVAMSDCIREFIRYRDFSILHFCALRTEHYASFILCWLKWPITNRSSLSGHDSWDPVHSIVMVKLVHYCRGES